MSGLWWQQGPAGIVCWPEVPLDAVYAPDVTGEVRLTRTGVAALVEARCDDLELTWHDGMARVRDGAGRVMTALPDVNGWYSAHQLGFDGLQLLDVDHSHWEMLRVAQGLEQIAAAAGLTFDGERDPDAFGLGHYALRTREGAQRIFVVSELYPAGLTAEYMVVAGWVWSDFEQTEQGRDRLSTESCPVRAGGDDVLRAALRWAGQFGTTTSLEGPAASFEQPAPGVGL